MTYNQGLSNGTNQIWPDGSFMSILLYSIFPAIQICDILYRDGIFKLLSSPGVDSKKSISPAYVARAKILKTFIEARQPM